MNPANETISGPGVDLERQPHLLDSSVPHHHHAVSERHCLDLVVRHIDRSGGDALAELLELDAHVRPELGVEIRQRLVEQEDLRMAHETTAEGDALLLAAGQFARLALEQVADAEDFGGAHHLLADYSLARTTIA